MAQTKAQLIDGKGAVDLGAFSISGSAPDNSVNLDASGRLLVGTSSASDSALLVVQGNSNSSSGSGVFTIKSGTVAVDYNAAGSDLALLNFKSKDSGNGAQIKAVTDGVWSSTSDCPTRLEFSTCGDGASSPTERMRIGQTGFLRASNTGSYPGGGGQHEFVSNSNNWIAQLTNSHGSSPFGLYIFYSASAPNDSGKEFIYCADTVATRFLVKSNGGINNYSGNNVNLSDEREKKNIEDLDSTWDCLKHWELKKFHYNADEDTNAKRYGVIAQQVEEHCPEVISEWVKQKAEPAKLDDEGNELEPAKEEIVRMGVKEQQMYWMAIKALQEAQVRIEQLEAEVAALKAQ